MKKALFLSLLCTLGAFAQMGERPRQLVAVEKVSYQHEEDVRRYTARVLSPSTVQVVSRVSGEIIEIGFKDGDFVKKGQMLYKLDPVQYYAAMLACEARVANCKADLIRYQAAIDEHLAKQEYAQNNFARNKALYDKSVVSKDTYETAVSAIDVAKAVTAGARADLEGAKAALQEAEANLIKAKDDYKNTTILAPMDGKVGVTEKTAGNYITPATGTLVTLLQTTPMRVRFALSMNDYLTLLDDEGKLNTEHQIRIKLANGKFYEEEGKLELVDNQVNRNTDSILLYALFNNAKGLLTHGSTLSLYLRFRTPRKSLAVFPSCVMHDSKSAYVYVVDADSKVQRREVTLGLATTDYQFIASGLAEGEVVIKDGMHKIMVGDAVNTTEEDTVNRE